MKVIVRLLHVRLLGWVAAALVFLDGVDIRDGARGRNERFSLGFEGLRPAEKPPPVRLRGRHSFSPFSFSTWWVGTGRSVGLSSVIVRATIRLNNLTRACTLGTAWTIRVFDIIGRQARNENGHHDDGDDDDDIARVLVGFVIPSLGL